MLKDVNCTTEIIGYLYKRESYYLKDYVEQISERADFLRPLTTRGLSGDIHEL